MYLINAWTWQVHIPFFLNVVDEHPFHVIPAFSHGITWVHLKTVFSKSILNIVWSWCWQFPTFNIWRWVVIKTFFCMKKRSSWSHRCLNSEIRLHFICNILVQSATKRKSLSFWKLKHLLWTWVIYTCMFLLWHFYLLQFCSFFNSKTDNTIEN